MTPVKVTRNMFIKLKSSFKYVFFDDFGDYSSHSRQNYMQFNEINYILERVSGKRLVHETES